MTKEFYRILVTAILNTADKLTADLDYLCSLVEEPDKDFAIRDAIVYANAVVTVSSHLNYVVEDLAENDLSEDENHVKLSREEVMMLDAHAENSEEAIQRLEEICGISLQSN